MNHYPKHVGDFAAATIGLSLAERGAYEALLDQYYAHERPLPLDRREVYRMAAAAASERKAVDYVLTRYFTQEADGWHNKRADEEIARYREKAAKAAQSASARWSGRNANAPPCPTPNAMRTHSEGNANQNQEPEPITDTSVGVSTPEVRDAPPPRKRGRAPKTPLPEGFAISDRVHRWAAEKGHRRLAERFEHFVGKVRQHGYVYADWDEALMTAIREDWARLNASPGDELQARKLQAARNMDILTGKVRDGRERIIDAERLDRASVFALPSRVREPSRDDVEGGRPDRSAGVVGG